MRSFTEPNGFWLSSLPMMRTFGFGDSTLTSTIGVLPMRSSTLPCTALVITFTLTAMWCTPRKYPT